MIFERQSLSALVYLNKFAGRDNSVLMNYNGLMVEVFMWKYELAVRVRDSVHVHMLCDVRWVEERWVCVRNNGDHV